MAALAYGLCMNNAFAYIDPASGSLAMQLLLGMVFGLMATMKLWLSKVRSLITRPKRHEQD